MAGVQSSNNSESDNEENEGSAASKQSVNHRPEGQTEEDRRSARSSTLSYSEDMVWVHGIGWRRLPDDAEYGSGPYWGWNAEKKWFQFNTQKGFGSVSSKTGGSSDSGAVREEWKEKEGNIPSWDGKTGHRTLYFRKIDLWCATTGCLKTKRAIKLLQALTGEAFEKLEHIDPESLRCEDGVERLKQHIVNVYEPIEDYRVGKVMDDFLEDFGRKKGQEILDYNLAWDKEVAKAEKVAGELTEKWKAHLYLKKMKLPVMAKTQVLTGSLGKYRLNSLSRPSQSPQNRRRIRISSAPQPSPSPCPL